VSSLLRYYKSLRISTQLALWFLLIALVPFACVGYFTYTLSVDSLYTQVINNLVAISQRQADEIERWVFERERDVATLARSPVVIQALVNQGRNNEPLKEQFFAYTEGGDYEDAYLIGTDGQMAFALHRRDLQGINLRSPSTAIPSLRRLLTVPPRYSMSISQPSRSCRLLARRRNIWLLRYFSGGALSGWFCFRRTTVRSPEW
jgi:hypothetical protein